MTNFFNKLSNLLEAIDNKAAETASSSRNKNNINDTNNDISEMNSFGDFNEDFENPQEKIQEKDTQEELEELKQQAHQDQIRLVALEEQLKEATGENSELSKLLSSSSEKDKKNQAQIQQKKRELITLKTKLDRLIQNDDKLNDDSKFEEILNQLKNDLKAIEEENDQLQLETSGKEIQIKEIEAKIDEKNEIIKKYEDELSETRSKAINKLSNSVESSEFLSNIEKFEKQRNDLKESIQKAQQKSAALEASIRELQEEANLEIKDEKKSIEKIQTELFKTKTSNETTRHEIDLINGQSKQELIEIEKTYQNYFENDKKLNEKELSRIKFRLESESIGQDRNINLIKAQSEIDQLQIKKAELLAIIEKQKSNEMEMKKREKRNENEIDAVPLVTLLPHSTIDTLYQPVENFDKTVTKIGHFFQKHPIYRLCIIILLFVCNIAFLFSLF